MRTGGYLIFSIHHDIPLVSAFLRFGFIVLVLLEYTIRQWVWSELSIVEGKEGCKTLTGHKPVLTSVFLSNILLVWYLWLLIGFIDWLWLQKIHERMKPIKTDLALFEDVGVRFWMGIYVFKRVSHSGLKFLNEWAWLGFSTSGNVGIYFFRSLFLEWRLPFHSSILACSIGTTKIIDTGHNPAPFVVIVAVYFLCLIHYLLEILGIFWYDDRQLPVWLPFFGS